jgi:PAS domain S-box-containing protein
MNRGHNSRLEAMIEDFLQDRAALYITGMMTQSEREEFELILEFHGELWELVCDLQEVGAAVVVSRLPRHSPAPPAELKSKVLRAIAAHSRSAIPESFVVTGPDRLVQWVNPAFTQMCGYTLDELCGQSLGPILQGKETDPVAVSRMRAALHDQRPCHETIVNYHKDGSTYWVDIAITPILDDADRLRWFVARESLAEPLAA